MDDRQPANNQDWSQSTLGKELARIQRNAERREARERLKRRKPVTASAAIREDILAATTDDQPMTTNYISPHTTLEKELARIQRDVERRAARDR